LRVFTALDDVSLTQQNFKAECDINNVVSRWQRTGVLTHVRDVSPHYGDFSSLKDYQASLNVVIEAEERFNALPSALRSRFANDPAQFLNFVNDPANSQELVKMGLANPVPVLDPVSTSVSPELVQKES